MQMWNKIYSTGQTVRLWEQQEVNEAAILTHSSIPSDSVNGGNVSYNSYLEVKVPLADVPGTFVSTLSL